jgi:hypothetical protein
VNLLANKIARTIWAMMITGERYREQAAAWPHIIGLIISKGRTVTGCMLIEPSSVTKIRGRNANFLGNKCPLSAGLRSGSDFNDNVLDSTGHSEFVLVFTARVADDR